MPKGFMGLVWAFNGVMIAVLAVIVLAMLVMEPPVPLARLLERLTPATGQSEVAAPAPAEAPAVEAVPEGALQPTERERGLQAHWAYEYPRTDQVFANAKVVWGPQFRARDPRTGNVAPDASLQIVNYFIYDAAADATRSAFPGADQYVLRALPLQLKTDRLAEADRPLVGMAYITVPRAAARPTAAPELPEPVDVWVSRADGSGLVRLPIEPVQSPEFYVLDEATLLVVGMEAELTDKGPLPVPVIVRVDLKTMTASEKKRALNLLAVDGR